MTESTEEEDNLFQPLIFTRYLYPKEHVMHSLFMSLLDHKEEEALFWGYEIYHSGFQTPLVEFIFNVYKEIYSNVNTIKFNQFIENQFEEWNEHPEEYWRIGTILWNLSKRNYDIHRFIENYFHVKTIPPLSNPMNVNKNQNHQKKFLLVLNKEDVEQYNTTNYANMTLSKNVVYGIRNDVQLLFLASHTDMKKEYYYHWLYYAYESPIWKERIEEYCGTKNDIEKTIDFENEDFEEKFMNLYNYDPDEQSIEIVEKNIGNCQCEQLSIREFSEKYGVNILLRKKIILSNK